MGEAKDVVQGSGPKPTPPPGALPKENRALDELSSRGKETKKEKKRRKKREVEGIIPAEGGNMINRVQGLRDEISRLIVNKEHDVENEGPSAKPDNVRKVAQLRSAYQALTIGQNNLEDY